MRLESVTKRYGDFVALNALTLDIEDGEFLSLLGPSGCGKTTTLRLIAGFLEPSIGRILFDGQNVSNWPPRKRHIGMVFQDYALFPHLSIGDNIGFGLKERGSARAEIRRRVGEMLDLVQLQGMEGRFPVELSGGQRQRVALARAVAFPPRVLLMDEPLGALDLKLREAMQIELRRIQRELRITTVYVTHDQTEAMNLSDRIALMNRARIVQLGPPEEIYSRPCNKFAADFVGAINFIPVLSWHVLDGQTQIESSGGGLSATASPPGGEGEIVLAVRPEHMRLTSRDRQTEFRNAVRGTVTGVRFGGNVLHVDVDVDVEKRDGLRLTVQTEPGDPFAVSGLAVQVIWDVNRGTLLRD